MENSWKVSGKFCWKMIGKTWEFSGQILLESDRICTDFINVNIWFDKRLSKKTTIWWICTDLTNAYLRRPQFCHFLENDAIDNISNTNTDYL